MSPRDTLPTAHLNHIVSLEERYLHHSDPILQSGFSGGPERWCSERSPLLDAIDTDGDVLDIGCANGHLLASLMVWGAARGLTLEAWGLDIGPKLIALARSRFPQHPERFFIGNAWLWTAPEGRRFKHVYMVHDCVPLDQLTKQTRHLLDNVVEPGGTLVLGAYGSQSRGLPPLDLEHHLLKGGFEVSGTAFGGEGPTTAFAWIEAPTLLR